MSNFVSSFGATLMLTFSACIRGAQSEYVVEEKGILGLASLASGICYLLYKKFTVQGDKAILPWYQKDWFLYKVDDFQVRYEEWDDSEYKFRPNILLGLLVTGLLEFGGSFFQLLSFNIAM